MTEEPGPVVHDLLRSIREFIQHPRRLDPLIKDKPLWNMLTSAFDVVSDAEMAIVAYELAPDSADTGTRYLMIYGLLQALYVQQDALENMVRAFDSNSNYRIDSEAEVQAIRQTRHDAVGHPTKQGGVNSRSGEQLSHFLVQYSLHKAGFTLMRTSNKAEPIFIDISIPDLIQKNRVVVKKVLKATMEKLEAIEMEHRNAFKGKPLLDFFPQIMGYHFEKLSSAIHSPSYGNQPMGEIGLQAIKRQVQCFKAALGERGLLGEHSNYGYEFDELEYAISELEQYLQGLGSLTDVRAPQSLPNSRRARLLILRRLQKA